MNRNKQRLPLPRSRHPTVHTTRGHAGEVALHTLAAALRSFENFFLSNNLSISELRERHYEENERDVHLQAYMRRIGGNTFNLGEALPAAGADE